MNSGRIPVLVWDSSETVDGGNVNITDYVAILFFPPPGEIWGQGTNASYCQMYGGDDCKYREAQGRCFENATDSSSTLQILDGNDFSILRRTVTGALIL